MNQLQYLTTIKRALGFTLVELLVALGLGVLMTSGIANIYLQNQQSYVQDEELARLQENARYALNMLKRDLTMTGFVGGLNDYDITPVALTSDCVSATNWATDVSSALDLINDAKTGTTLSTIGGVDWNCITTGTIVDLSDIISIKRTADRFTLKDGTLNTGVTADDDQWYLRAYDSKASLTLNYLASGGSIPVADATAGSLVDYWEFYSRIFFLRDYSKTVGDGIPTLCLAELSADAMVNNCYVEGIEDLQLEIGIDSNDDSVPDQFKADPTLAELTEAVVIRVYLLVRSVNPIVGYSNTKSYNLGSKTVAAKNDGYMRRVLSTTVQMRNAKLPNA